MMRRSGYVYLFLIILIVIGLPSVIVNRGNRLTRRSSDKQYYSEEQTEKSPGEAGIVALYINSSGKVEKIPIEEYVKGVVAAEMPGSFHMEALKAQAVAARTYAYKRLK